MPWQQYVADVALEINPLTGLLQYREVDLTVPRQSGKTTLILGAVVQRSLMMGPRQTSVYTAQTRGKARQKWNDDHLPIIEASVFARLIKDIRLANDSEALYWQNGSRYGIDAGTETSGHGSTLDMAVVDEAFSEVDSRKERSFRPTMITRPEPQLWVVSTAGTAKSVYLKSKVDAGRKRHLSGVVSRSTCYFEWSAPDNADWLDRAVWRACMPALGYTVSIDTIEAELESLMETTNGEDDFRRAYLNQWRDGVAVLQVIAAEDWLDAEDVDSRIADDSPRVFALDVSPDRSWSAIAVAGQRDDGLDHVEVVEYRRGTDWAAGRLAELRGRWNAPGPVILTGPAARSLTDELSAVDVDYLVMSGPDMTAACGQLFDRIPARCKHIGQTSLNGALSAASKRAVGAAWVWDTRGPIIAPLVAATASRWGLSFDEFVDLDPLDSLY